MKPSAESCEGHRRRIDAGTWYVESAVKDNKQCVAAARKAGRESSLHQSSFVTRSGSTWVKDQRRHGIGFASDTDLRNIVEAAPRADGQYVNTFGETYSERDGQLVAPNSTAARHFV